MSKQRKNIIYGRSKPRQIVNIWWAHCR